jgi:hypothetical protein
MRACPEGASPALPRRAIGCGRVALPTPRPRPCLADPSPNGGEDVLAPLARNTPDRTAHISKDAFSTIRTFAGSSKSRAFNTVTRHACVGLRGRDDPCRQWRRMGAWSDASCTRNRWRYWPFGGPRRVVALHKRRHPSVTRPLERAGARPVLTLVRSSRARRRRRGPSTGSAYVLIALSHANGRSCRRAARFPPRPCPSRRRARSARRRSRRGAAPKSDA